ncbi:MAG: hypothetical protein R2800_04980 [Flavipsychrobacter sp.]
MYRVLLASVLLLSCSTYSFATNDALQECIAQMTSDKTDVYTYTHSEYKTYHSPRPWMTSHIAHSGTMWVSSNSISLRDSFATRDRAYISLKTFKEGVLLKQPLNSKQPAKITKSMLANEVFRIAKHHPILLLQKFGKLDKTNTQTSNKEHTIYSNKINDVPISLYINRYNQLDMVTITIDDELYGDVVYTIRYTNYTNIDKDIHYHYPQTITFEQVNGITDTLHLQYVKHIDKAPVLIEQPADYKIHDDEPEVPHTATTQKLSDHLYAIHLPQAESAALLVALDDFFVVVDAPLNSKNGELVLAEAKKIAPNKPVKYYSFCHHHPWYIGGIRPFVHADATVLTQASDISYLEFITLNPHTLSPDSLELQPKLLLTEVVEKTKTITDGKYKMILYHIGEKSEHTDDYTLFYFPEEKILFQGDMAFIKDGAPLRKAGSKQIALYNAIKELDLEVDTIVQAWPWKNRYNMKTIIPFAELEASVQMNNEK